MSEPQRYRVRGPNGAVIAVQVPSPGMDERTFTRRVDSGEFTVLEKPSGDSEDETGTDVDVDRPAQADRKEVWIDYVVQVMGLSRTEAESYTKQDLIDLVDET